MPGPGCTTGYSVDVWRYVARLLGPDAAAVGDVVQETFLEAARSARNFDPSRGTLWSWLVGIAHHRVSAHWRQANRQTRLRQLAESGEVDVRHLFDGQPEAMTAAESRDTPILFAACSPSFRPIMRRCSRQSIWTIAAWWRCHTNSAARWKRSSRSWRGHGGNFERSLSS